MQEATFYACKHCIMHTGLETLTAMERVPTDADDRPKTDIRITGATVFVNPYKDEEEAERKVAEAERLKVCKPAFIHARYGSIVFSLHGSGMRNVSFGRQALERQCGCRSLLTFARALCSDVLSAASFHSIRSFFGCLCTSRRRGRPGSATQN